MALPRIVYMSLVLGKKAAEIAALTFVSERNVYCATIRGALQHYIPISAPPSPILRFSLRQVICNYLYEH